MNDNLCTTGTALWMAASAANFRESGYRKYVDHIMGCEVCQKELEMTKEDVDILKEFWNNSKSKFINEEIINEEKS